MIFDLLCRLRLMMDEVKLSPTSVSSAQQIECKKFFTMAILAFLLE